jgi:hypothetical protein
LSDIAATTADFSNIHKHTNKLSVIQSWTFGTTERCRSAGMERDSDEKDMVLSGGRKFHPAKTKSCQPVTSLAFAISR